MLENLRKRQRGDEGFTLIELLIVIVILGILAAVVVISVGGITDRGGKSACESTRTAITTAAEAAYAQTGSYPLSAAALQTGGFLNAGGATINGSTITGKPNWTLTYAVSAGPPASVSVTGACP